MNSVIEEKTLFSEIEPYLLELKRFLSLSDEKYWSLLNLAQNPRAQQTKLKVNAIFEVIKDRNTFDAYRATRKYFMFRQTIHGFSRRIQLEKRNFQCPNKYALDYGCGVGIYTRTLITKGYQVDVCDIGGSSADFIFDYLRKNNPSSKIFVVTEKNKIPVLPENKYGLVLLLDVLEHLESPLSVLKLVTQSLCRNGVLNCTTGIQEDGLFDIYGPNLRAHAKQHREIVDFMHNNFTKGKKGIYTKCQK